MSDWIYPDGHWTPEEKKRGWKLTFAENPDPDIGAMPRWFIEQVQVELHGVLRAAIAMLWCEQEEARKRREGLN